MVAHGSPRHVRDAVTCARTDDELAAMFDGESDATSRAFVGHTHRPLDRALPPRGGSPARRFVNVGSAGEPMDGDTRACDIVAQRDVSNEPAGAWPYSRLQRPAPVLSARWPLERLLPRRQALSLPRAPPVRFRRPT